MRLIACWGYRLETTAKLIALGLLESAAPDAAPDLTMAKTVEGQRDRRRRGREEERPRRSGAVTLEGAFRDERRRVSPHPLSG